MNEISIDFVVRKQPNGVPSNPRAIETFTIPCSLEVTLEKAKVRLFEVSFFMNVLNVDGNTY